MLDPACLHRTDQALQSESVEGVHGEGHVASSPVVACFLYPMPYSMLPLLTRGLVKSREGADPEVETSLGKNPKAVVAFTLRRHLWRRLIVR